METASNVIENKVKVWTGRFFAFMLIATSMDTARFMVNSTISLVANAAGASTTLVGFISSVMGITAFLLMLIAGPATVVIKPNILLAVGCFGTALSYIMLSFNNLNLYIAARAVDGLCNAFLGPALMMIVRDIIVLDKSGTSMGIFQMRNSIGKVVGPILGVNGLAMFVSYVFNFRVSAGIWIVCGLVAATFKLKNTDFKPAPFRLKPTNIIPKGTLLPFLTVILFQVGQMAMGSFNTVYAKTQLGIANVGVMMSAGNICAIFIAPLIASLGDKIGLKKGIFLSMLIWLCGPLAFALIAKDLITVCIAAGFQYVGFSAMAAMMSALLVKRAPRELAGVVGNAYFGGMNLGSFFGPLAAGVIVDAFGYKTMYLALMVPLALCALLVQVYTRRAAAAGEKI
jgi:MFS family permease